MATYKETVGTAVVNYAGNYPGAVKGELWYDSTNKDFKYQYVSVASAAWASGNAMNTARSSGGFATAGAQNTALAFGGDNQSPPPTNRDTGNTESYNGTNWTELNDLNTTRRLLAGAGTQTSALAFGGTIPPSTAVTELWNGSNWTEVNDLNSAASNIVGFGADNTSALQVGAAGVEKWNGTNWTEVTALNTSRRASGGAGIITAGLVFGGANPPDDSPSALTEQYNGTNWTEVGDLNLGRQSPGRL